MNHPVPSAIGAEPVDEVTGSGRTQSGADPTLGQLREENDQLKATIRQTEAHRQITGELAKAGARSPELLFDSIRDDLQFSPDGKVENAQALIERLRSKFPEQFGSEERHLSIDAGAGRYANAPLTKTALAKMKTEEIAELDWADVRRVLAQG